MSERCEPPREMPTWLCPCCGPEIKHELTAIKHLIAVELTKFGSLSSQLDAILSQGRIIMAQLDDALAALKKIDDATTKQGLALEADGNSLQTVSDNLDALIAKLGTTVPPDVLAGLQAQADKAQALSDKMDLHAAFSKALAAKGAPDPVPVPVPVPVPPVTPITP